MNGSVLALEHSCSILSRIPEFLLTNSFLYDSETIILIFTMETQFDPVWWNMVRSRFLISTFFLICFISVSSAAVQTFVREYTYTASPLDSKITCQAIALEQVKREILEELGTYVENKTVVKNYSIDNDQIKVMTGGVVQTKIIEEKWDGKEYWLKAQVAADPNDVASSIEKMRKDEQLTQELAEARMEAAEALEQVAQLKQQLEGANTDKTEIQEQYNKEVNQIAATDLFEKGSSFSQSGDYKSAVDAYGQAMALSPEDSKVYINRSFAFIQLGNYAAAAKDLDQATVLNPRMTNSYINRVVVSKRIYENRQASLKPAQYRPRAFRTAGQDPLQRMIAAKRQEQKEIRINTAMTDKPRAEQNIILTQQPEKKNVLAKEGVMPNKFKNEQNRKRIENERKAKQNKKAVRRQKQEKKHEEKKESGK